MWNYLPRGGYVLICLLVGCLLCVQDYTNTSGRFFFPEDGEYAKKEAIKFDTNLDKEVYPATFITWEHFSTFLLIAQWIMHKSNKKIKTYGDGYLWRWSDLAN